MIEGQENEKKKSNSFSEITITVKDDEKTHKMKHLVYSPYVVSQDDPLILRYIQQALEEFKGEPTDIRIKINFDVI